MVRGRGYWGRREDGVGGDSAREWRGESSQRLKPRLKALRAAKSASADWGAAIWVANLDGEICNLAAWLYHAADFDIIGGIG